MPDIDLQWFNHNLDLEALVNHYGWQQKKGSTKNSLKYSDGEHTIIIKKSNNSFWHANSDNKGGGPVAFVQQQICPNIPAGKWSADVTKKVFDELYSLKGMSNEFVAKKPFEPKKFSKNNQYKTIAFHDKHTKPAGAHPYLVNDRKISAELLKHKKFTNCLRMTKEAKYHQDALFFHQDENGYCAYEKQNTRPFGNVKFFNADGKKTLWYTDDVFSSDVETVFIGEAAIDALSAASLVEQDMALVSPCGGFDKRIYEDDEKTVITKHNPHLDFMRSFFDKVKAKQIILGHDNDSAGRDYDQYYQDFFNEFFPDRFKVQVEKAPMALNDWNNYLHVVDLQNKTKFLDMAKVTNELIIAEGGVNKFRLIPSKVKPGAVIMVLPPAGFASSNLEATAQSFMYTMRKFNENSVVTYAHNLRKSYSHAKSIEKWRRDFLPSLEYKKIESDPISFLKENNKLSDPSIANDWEGYTESLKHPHKLAESASEVVITRSYDDRTRYYHSSYPPMSVILAVPSPELQIEAQKKNKDLLFDARGFIEAMAKNSLKEKCIRFSPAVQTNKKMTISHCAFIKDQIMKEEKLFKGVSLQTDEPVKGFNNVLDVLANKNLLISDSYHLKFQSKIVSINKEIKKQQNVQAKVDPVPTISR